MKLSRRKLQEMIREELAEVSPPGREKQVKALKGKVDNPWAVAWAQHNKYGRPNKKRKKTTREMDEVDQDHLDLDECDEGDDYFSNWTDDQAKRAWKSMGGTFDSVVRKSKEFTDDPYAYAAALQKRVVGKWPTAKEGVISLRPILSEQALDALFMESDY